MTTQLEKDYALFVEYFAQYKSNLTKIISDVNFIAAYYQNNDVREYLKKLYDDVRNLQNSYPKLQSINKHIVNECNKYMQNDFDKYLNDIERSNDYMSELCEKLTGLIEEQTQKYADNIFLTVLEEDDIAMNANLDKFIIIINKMNNDWCVWMMCVSYNEAYNLFNIVVNLMKKMTSNIDKLVNIKNQHTYRSKLYDYSNKILRYGTAFNESTEMLKQYMFYWNVKCTIACIVFVLIGVITVYVKYVKLEQDMFINE